MTSWQDLLRRASALRQTGRFEEAIAAYEKLLSVKPDLPDSWYNLAWLQRQTGSFDAALLSYERALELGVSQAEEVHLNRAVILSDHLHLPQEAESELRAALGKKPDYVPALLNLGNLHEDRGNRILAKEAYQQVLAIEPDNSLALARLANLSHSRELDLSMAEKLRTAIRLRANVPAEQADLGFALAGLLDFAGEYDEAFEAARTANEASRNAAGASGRYDRTAAAETFGQIRQAFPGPMKAETAASEPAPIFICGLHRSGSTLVEQLLATHSRVRAGGELDLIPSLVGRIRDYPSEARDLDPVTIKQWRDFYLKGLPARPDAQLQVTDKRPENFLHIGLIKTLFPSAKIIHTRRDYRDNLLSLYFLHLDPSFAYATDLDDAADWYGHYLELMSHWKNAYGDDILDVDYDQLVRNPLPVFEELLNFLGLEWEDGLLEFHRQQTTVKTASVWQVREPLHARSSGRWRNYARHLGSLKDRFAREQGLAD